MASVSMVASFVGGAAVSQQVNNRRGLLMVKATARAEGQDVGSVNVESKEGRGSEGRRAAMLVMAAAAITAVAGSGRQGMEAFADEPKRGTEEARKKYAPVCVTMPTSRICNKIA